MRQAISHTFIAWLIGVLSTVMAVSAHAQEEATPVTTDPENTLLIKLPDGLVRIAMRPDKAPQHVERVKRLARDGFYDGVVFHRVIDRFMAQGGDPTGTGTSGSDYKNLPAEFNDLSHKRGVASMARSRSPNSANSQFFIMLADRSPSGGSWSQLDGQYTVWGEVTEGMEHVDAINKGEPPANPTAMEWVRVAADVKDPNNLQPGEGIIEQPEEPAPEVPTDPLNGPLFRKN